VEEKVKGPLFLIKVGVQDPETKEVRKKKLRQYVEKRENLCSWNKSTRKIGNFTRYEKYSLR
jgi:hypothetical protein